MYLPKGAEIKNSHLYLNGVDLCSLAEKYGTPLYVMSEDIIRENCRLYKKTLDSLFPDNEVLFASKAFSCKEIYRIIAEEGLGADTVSGGEIYTALSAGFNPSKLYFHGCSKTDDELKYALENKIGRIVVDNKEELLRIDSFAKEMGIKASVSFRIKPGIDAHTHSAIMTGQIDSKFGFALENGEAEEIIALALSLESVELSGVHCHIGSQIFDIEPFKNAAKVMMKFISDMKLKTGYEIPEINLGGGFGIRYTDSDDPHGYGEFASAVFEEIKASAEEHGLNIPKIVIEPGRSIVGEAGLTLYKVGAVKEIKGIRKYVMIDGGMTDNPRYALYESEYKAIAANKADEPASEKITLAGKCCESGDLIGKDMELAPVIAGDIIAVLSTGAYNYSMSSNYNRIPRPAVVMLKGDEDRLIVKRETYEDIIKNDI